MGRVGRVDVGGMVYHVLNRANFRSRLFRSPAHYQEFLSILEESLKFVPMRILAYCLMPNHWHLVLYPRADGDLVKFVQRVTLTHTQRYHAKTLTVGYGHVYQGRYKSLVAISSCPGFCVLNPRRFAAAMPDGKTGLRREASLRIETGFGLLLPKAIAGGR